MIGEDWLRRRKLKKEGVDSSGKDTDQERPLPKETIDYWLSELRRLSTEELEHRERLLTFHLETALSYEDVGRRIREMNKYGVKEIGDLIKKYFNKIIHTKEEVIEEFKSDLRIIGMIATHLSVRGREEFFSIFLPLNIDEILSYGVNKKVPPDLKKEIVDEIHPQLVTILRAFEAVLIQWAREIASLPRITNESGEISTETLPRSTESQPSLSPDTLPRTADKPEDQA